METTVPMSQTADYRKKKNREYYLRKRQNLKKFCNYCKKNVSANYWSRHVKTMSHRLLTGCLIAGEG